MKSIIYILSLFVLMSYSSCEKEKVQTDSLINIRTKIDTIEIKKIDAIKRKQNSGIERDSTLRAQKGGDVILTFSEDKIDTLLGFCNCEKNIKKNTLKIQVRTEFPSLSELKKGNRSPTEFRMGVERQYRFVTFYLRDSIVEKVKIFMASTESQFDNKKIDSASIQFYSIRINRFDFKIAQNVWGNYEIELSKPFGYTESDNKIKGTFHCNNWKIVEYEDLSGCTIKGQNYIE